MSESLSESSYKSESTSNSAPVADAAPAGGLGLATDVFYAGVPVFEGFASLMDPSLYRPLPADWFVGMTDVVSSTQAIAEGRYKTVNTAGAAAIAAVGNGLAGRDFPFVFSGDGASFAVSATDAGLAESALAATAAFVRDELALDLRAGLIPVDAIRQGGFDVRIARFAASPNVNYAMFAGGGLAFSERRLKRGDFAVVAAPPGTRPDLTGLSCRWQEMPATHGVVLSLIVVPVADKDPAAFRRLVEKVLSYAGKANQAGTPVPEHGPVLGWPPQGLDLEARASRRPGGSLLLRRVALFGRSLFDFLVMRIGIRLGRFDPARYRREVVENADFRKYEDGLRMTLDCTPELADRIEARLAMAAEAGFARYGLHRQDAAIMTCIVPSVQQGNHVHFIDGADGGYAAAAAALKASADAFG
jgi:hypothetical protein